MTDSPAWAPPRPRKIRKLDIGLLVVIGLVAVLFPTSVAVMSMSCSVH